MRSVFPRLLLTALLFNLGAVQIATAGNYFCANGATLYLENGRERCSDGGIPVFRADSAPVQPGSSGVEPVPAAAPVRAPIRRVEALRCSPDLRCASAPDPASGEWKLSIEGVFPGQAGARTRAELIRRDSGTVIDTGEAALPEDRFLGFRFPVSALAPGAYRFRVVSMQTGKVLGEASFRMVALKGPGAGDARRPAEETKRPVEETKQPAQEAKPQPAGPAAKAGTLSGLYWCVAPSWSKGTIHLLPDGTYQMNGQASGRYTAGQGEVRFDGQLKDWNNGVARIEDGNLIFEWKNGDGSMQYFAYARGGD